MPRSATPVRALTTAGFLVQSLAMLLHQPPDEQSVNGSFTFDKDRLFTDMCGEAGGKPPAPGSARAKAVASEEAIPPSDLSGPCDWRMAFRMLTGTSAPMAFNQCALVGSSQDLEGARLGKEIDDHDTVIRVNRLPIKAYRHDFGARTDVLFTAPVQDGREQFSPQGLNFREMAGGRRSCPYERQCPFSMVILKGADTYECGSTFKERFPPSEPGWVPPPTSVTKVAYQLEAVNALAYELLGFDTKGKRPTNGFQAFLTFAFACEVLDVYGFSGNSTADNHIMKSLHDVDAEHYVMDQILKRSAESQTILSLLYPSYQSCLATKGSTLRKKG